MRKDRLLFSPDGRYLSVGTMPHTLLDTTGGSTGSIGYQYDDSDYAEWGHCFVRGGTACAYLTHNNALVVHDLRTGHEDRRDFARTDFIPHDLTAGPGGAPIYLAGREPSRLGEIEVRELDAVTLEQRSAFARYPGNVERLVVSADGTRLAAGSTSVRVWNIAGGKRPTRAAVVVQPKGSLHGFDLTADGSHVAVADSYALGLWDASTGERVAHSGQHRRRVTTVARHPLRPVLATGDGGGFVFLWDTACRVLQRFEWGLSEIRGLCFAADGLRCAAVDSAGKVVVWDVDA